MQQSRSAGEEAFFSTLCLVQAADVTRAQVTGLLLQRHGCWLNAMHHVPLRMSEDARKAQPWHADHLTHNSQRAYIMGYVAIYPRNYAPRCRQRCW